MAILGDVSEAEIAILADPDGDQGQVDEIVARAYGQLRRGSSGGGARGRGSDHG